MCYSRHLEITFYEGTFAFSVFSSMFLPKYGGRGVFSHSWDICILGAQKYGKQNSQHILKYSFNVIDLTGDYFNSLRLIVEVCWFAV